EELVAWRSDRVDDEGIRARVIPVVGGVAARGGGVVGRSLVDLRDVAAIGGAEAVLAVAAQVVACRQARAESAVVDGLVPGLIGAERLVIANSHVEAPVVVQLPLVVEEPRARGEVGSSRQRGNGIPLDLAGVWIHAEEDILYEIDEVAVDAKIAAGLEVVLVALLMELLEASDEAVVAGRPSAEEIGRLSQPALVVPLLGPARSAAEGRRPPPLAGVGVEQQSALDQVAGVGPEGELVLHLAVLALQEEAIREDTVVLEGTELPEVVAEREAAQVDDATGGDEVSPLQIAVDVGPDERVLVRDPPGELALDPPVVPHGVVGNVGVES